LAATIYCPFEEHPTVENEPYIESKSHVAPSERLKAIPAVPAAKMIVDPFVEHATDDQELPAAPARLASTHVVPALELT